MRHLKHDQDAGHGRAHHCAECRAHAHDGQHSHAFGRYGINHFHQAGDAQPGHRAEKECGRKNSAAAAHAITSHGGRKFCREQQQGGLPNEFAGECGGQIIVAQTEHAEFSGVNKNERAQRPANQSADGGTQPYRHAGKFFLAGAQAERGFLERHANECSGDGDQGHEQIRMPRWFADGRNGKRWLRPDDAVRHQRAEHRAQQYASQQTAVQIAN